MPRRLAETEPLYVPTSHQTFSYSVDYHSNDLHTFHHA